MTTNSEAQSVLDPQHELFSIGERFLPRMNEFIATSTRTHRYLYASRYTAGKRVLDIACGDGYGSQILARNAQWVLGVDSDARMLDHARSDHAAGNIRYVRADAQQFHLAPGSMDIVVSFETLEHLPAQRAFLSAMKSLLAPDGMLLLSAPNNVAYLGDQPLHNPMHVPAFDHSELLALLKTLFKNVEFNGQRMVATSLIAGITGDSFPRQGMAFTPVATVVDPDRRKYPEEDEERAIAPHCFLVVCSDASLPLASATFLLDSHQILWEHVRDLESRLTNHVQRAQTERAETHAKLWQAEIRAWEAEADLAETHAKLRGAETRACEAETALEGTRTRLDETQTQLAHRDEQVQYLRMMPGSLLRTLLGHPALATSSLRALVLIPGGVNYFYDQTGYRLAESLAALGFTVDVSSLGELPEVHPRYDWTLVVNIAEVLLAFSVTNTAARLAGQITPEEQSRALARLARVHDESRAIAAVQLDSAGTHWFDHAHNLCALAKIPTVFDLGFHDQSAVLLPQQRARYQFVFNGLTDSERMQLDTLPNDDARPVPWVFVGHLTPDRTDLVRTLVREFDPRGFVYMPMLAPFTQGGPHLDEAQFGAVLSRAQYQVWRSHHAHFYLESERFRQSALAGGVPVKLMTAPLPSGPIPFRDFLVDAETFASQLREWDFMTMRRRVAEEFRMLPSLDNSLLAALAVCSPARQYGT